VVPWQGAGVRFLKVGHMFSLACLIPSATATAHLSSAQLDLAPGLRALPQDLSGVPCANPLHP